MGTEGTERARPLVTFDRRMSEAGGPRFADVIVREPYVLLLLDVVEEPAVGLLAVELFDSEEADAVVEAEPLVEGDGLSASTLAAPAFSLSDPLVPFRA